MCEWRPVLVCWILGLARGSEFPERECCDAIFPLAAVSASISPDTPTPHPPVTTLTAKGNENIETLNCMLSRQLCFEDPSCSPILETIPRVCGPETVSCSTVTVTKCQAALRTLQAFPFFKPTCLCREPQVDHDCNSFRNFLFDHPCIFVMKKEKDPYPVDALPTCNHALAVCQKDATCTETYDNFKSHCKVRDGKCHMDSRELCNDSWTKIRLTPMFGCICPNNHMKKRCERIFVIVNNNPCIVSLTSVGGYRSFRRILSPWVHRGDIQLNYNHIINLFSKKPEASSIPGQKPDENSTSNFQNTCNKALDSCIDNTNCKTGLENVMQYCSVNRCQRENCMQALQSFYRNVEPTWSLEIAFCLCRKTKNPQDDCLVAQELLHPVCAQQPETKIIPTCHSLAQTCGEDTKCRVGLENYVQACAVDSVTKQCAGPAESCRRAMLGILGTVLRSNCACKGTDFSQLYDCMGWQRVLWFNPCVVESQRDFHAKKSIISASSNIHTTTIRNAIIEVEETTPTTRRTTTTRPTTIRTTTRRITTTTTTRPTTTTRRPTTTIITTTAPVELITLNETIDNRTSSALAANSVTSSSISTYFPTTSTHILTSAFNITLPVTHTTIQTTQSPSTTTEIITSSARYCVVQKPLQPDQHILEGDGRRIYREGEPDCSDVCQCGDGSLICNTICVERHPCKTDFAFYNHAAPAYQAYRGRCLCYSGRFVCMRPPPDTYELPQGVFLFLGYSEADEALLKPLIKLELPDAVASLNSLLKLHLKPKTPCVLSIFRVSTENIILVATLSEVNSSLTRYDVNPSLLMKQKEECLGPLQEITDMVNSQNPIVHSDLLLSIFKMAEVEIVYPAINSSTLGQSPTLNLVIGLYLILLLMSIAS